MLQGILYFGLGFLSSALIALMISPAVWNRAVVLTKRASRVLMPLTLNEIQGGQDQLRAEFAMSTRRLELSVDELRDKASRQVIEIGRKRDELAKLAEESQDRIRTIEELETRGAEMRAAVARTRGTAFHYQSAARGSPCIAGGKGTRAGADARQTGEAEADSDSRRIELVAKQTAVENLSDQVGDFSKSSSQIRNEVEQAHEAAREHEKQLKAEQRRTSKLEAVRSGAKQLSELETACRNANATCRGVKPVDRKTGSIPN
ncbi:MAG: hypothetical protein R3D29_12530 [Nitratireductor sp.]